MTVEAPKKTKKKSGPRSRAVAAVTIGAVAGALAGAAEIGTTRIAALEGISGSIAALGFIAAVVTTGVTVFASLEIDRLFKEHDIVARHMRRLREIEEAKTRGENPFQQAPTQAQGQGPAHPTPREQAESAREAKASQSSAAHLSAVLGVDKTNGG